MVSGVTQAADFNPRPVYEIVLNEEAKIAIAIKGRNARALSLSGDRLGRVVDRAHVRVRRGAKVSECEMAAESLAFTAIALEKAFGSAGEVSLMLVDIVENSIKGFRNDIRNCERELREAPQVHRAVEKAYKALRENGKS